MDIRIDSKRDRTAVLAVSAVVATLVIWQAAKIWRADSLIRSGQLAKMERGARLESANGEAWDRLGREYEWDLANADPGKALSNFSRAVEINPLSAHYWLDLASAYEFSGDMARAREAFEKAKSVYPASAEVAWYYGNFLLRQQDPAKGFPEIQRAVRTDPIFLSLAISRTWRANHDVKLLLDRVLPADMRAYLAALAYLSSVHEGGAALVVWQRMISLGTPFTLNETFPFFDELIHEDRSQDAARAWRQALAATGLPSSEPADHSLIWDGDFARDFLNGGLGWRYSNPVGITIDFDSAPPASSGRSVRLDFGGGMNLDVTEPLQYVPVEPSRTFRFHARLRTETVSTESGVRFALTDPNHAQAVHLLTENFIGSHPWTVVEEDVQTGPDTHFLIVQLRRTPSRLFENKLSGTAWVSDLSLVLQSGEAVKAFP